MNEYKSFLLKRIGKCYCSKCMNEITIDKNNPKNIAIRNHEKECNTVFINSQTPRNFNDVYAFSFSIDNNKLKLSIYKGELSNESFQYNEIYRALFEPNSKEIEEEGEENIDYWISIMEENFFYDDIYDLDELNLSNETSDSTIRKVFPNIGYIKNIPDFIRIYKTKGYRLPEKSYEKELAKIPAQKLDLNIGKSYSRQRIKICFYREHIIENKAFIEVNYVYGLCKDGKVEPLEKNRVIISDNYIYNPKNIDMRCFYEDNIIHKPYKFNKFYELCPEVKLKEYIESGGTKIVPFILSTNNDLKLELIGKAGLGYIADNYQYIEDADFSATNVKKMFGLPIKALKCLNSMDFVDYIFSKRKLEEFKKIYKIQRMVFNGIFTKETLEFIKDNIRQTPKIGCFNEKDILKYINYTQNVLPNIKTEENMSNVAFYSDYLNMCNMYNLYPGGKFPDNLKHYHDLMVMYKKERYEADKAEAFSLSLANPNYYNLATRETKQSEFVILLPRCAQDLVEESYNMNNCVRGYVDRVANGHTYILFLRRKSEKSKSLVTIEVSTDYKLIQAKASYNRKPSDKVISFIKKWCSLKDIDCSNCRDVKIDIDKL